MTDEQHRRREARSRQFIIAGGGVQSQEKGRLRLGDSVVWLLSVITGKLKKVSIPES